VCARSSDSRSDGFMKSSVLRGRLLRLRANGRGPGSQGWSGAARRAPGHPAHRRAADRCGPRTACATSRSTPAVTTRQPWPIWSSDPPLQRRGDRSEVRTTWGSRRRLRQLMLGALNRRSDYEPPAPRATPLSSTHLPPAHGAGVVRHPNGRRGAARRAPAPLRPFFPKGESAARRPFGDRGGLSGLAKGLVPLGQELGIRPVSSSGHDQ
jgi:hypothetical protein